MSPSDSQSFRQSAVQSQYRDLPPRQHIHEYNPQEIAADRLEKLFVVRIDLLRQLIAAATRKRGRNHQLIVGLRGMGKTTLLKRIADELRQRHFASIQPLLFREEQYNVDRLSELVRNWLRALLATLQSDSRTTQSEDIGRIQEILRQPPRDEQAAVKTAMEFLESWRKRCKKRLVLLIDNIDQIVEGLGAADTERFRTLVEGATWLTMIAATPNETAFAVVPEAPLYGFFPNIHYLSGLTLEEVRLLLKSLARDRKTPEVLQAVERHPDRLVAFQILTGGSVRTIVILHDILAADAEGEADVLLDLLLDRHTPLFKARFEELPRQSRKVADVLLRNWDPLSAAELAEQAALETGVVSAQLDRLFKLGFVKEAPPTEQDKKKRFEAAERFFNIWFLMRSSPELGPDERMKWLVECIASLFGEEGLRERTLWRKQRLATGEIAEAYRWRHEGFVAYSERRALLKEREFLANSQFILPKNEEFTNRSQLEQRFLEVINTTNSENSPEWIPLLTQVIESPDTSPILRARAYLHRGFTYGNQGRVDDEIADFNAVIGMPDSPAELRARAYLNRGVTYTYQDRQADAIFDYTVVIGMSDATVMERAGAYLNRSVAYHQQGQLEDAISDCATVIEMPDAPPALREAAYLKRGIMYGLQDRAGESISDYTAVIEMPDATAMQRATAYINRGIEYCQSRRLDDAISDYTAVIGMSDAPPEASARAYLNRGVTFSLRHQFEDALSDYAIVIEMTENEADNAAHPAAVTFSSMSISAGVWNGIAWTLFQYRERHRTVKIGETEHSAFSAANKAVQLEPATGAFQHTLACAAGAEGQWDISLQAVEKYLAQSSPEDLDITDLAEWAEAFARAGKSREAIDFLTRHTLEERYRPLLAALKAVEAGDRRHISRYAQEIRPLAEKILKAWNLLQ